MTSAGEDAEKLELLYTPGGNVQQVRSLGQEDALEKGQATHSSIHGLPWWLGR